jgi:hypothetical protein
MFIKPQEPSIMKAKKRHIVYILSLLIAALSITSCSSVGDMPKDDIYYSRNSDNPSEYNWDDFQKNTESYGSKTVTSNVSSSDSYDYNSSYQEDVAGNETADEYEYIDEYYDGSYESRLERFGSNSSGSNFGYYDDYYTGYNNCYSCNSGPNVSLGFSFGMGYGYGYPYYPYYSYYPSFYYPYYSPYYYPYYGYNSSYWAGYNAGYWNGYYGYPYGYGGGYYPGYGGGYYPDYYGGTAVAYGPRGSNVTGTTIPRNRTGSSGSTGNINQKTVVAGGAISPVSRGESTVMSSGVENTTNQVVSGRNVKIGKPDSEITTGRDVNPQNVVTGNRSSISTNRQTQKTYQKPKSYQNLSTQQTKSRSEYVRPTNKTEVGSVNQNRSNIRTNPTTPRDINNTGSGKKEIYTPSRSRTSSYERTAPSKSYSSPSRSNSSSRSYSSPSTTTRSGNESSSVRSTRSTSNSSGSSSRSYGSSSSRSGSSGTTSGTRSGGGGGSPKRR